jgi:phosphate transport system protein
MISARQFFLLTRSIVGWRPPADNTHLHFPSTILLSTYTINLSIHAIMKLDYLPARRKAVTRVILDAQLRQISAGIIQLGTHVETALSQAIQAVQSGDQALCSQVIEADSAINDLRFEVEHLAFKSLTLQQPLAGRDLRFLSSVPSITTDLERMGDNAAGIAKLLTLMAPLQAMGTKSVSPDPDRDRKPPSDHAITEDAIVAGLLDLGQEACQVLRGTIQAFKQSDADAARKIWKEDDVVDVRYHLVRHSLMTMLTGTHAIAALQQDPLVVLRTTYWFWIAHNLERVGDHCTNICERIVFFLEGKATIEPTETE